MMLDQLEILFQLLLINTFRNLLNTVAGFGHLARFVALSIYRPFCRNVVGEIATVRQNRRYLRNQPP